MRGEAGKENSKTEAKVKHQKRQVSLVT